jgi:hypothetical protein
MTGSTPRSLEPDLASSDGAANTNDGIAPSARPSALIQRVVTAVKMNLGASSHVDWFSSGQVSLVLDLDLQSRTTTL